MSVIMKIVSSISMGATDFDGEYVTDLDVDFMNGLGRVKTTPEIADARIFDDLMAATQFWKTQSKVKPYRDDGRPNRPLTAFTVQMITVS